MVADPSAEQLSVHRGQLVTDSAYVFETRHGGGLKISGQRSVVTTQLFKHKEFNFEKLGIGGLDDQFEQIFRRAFASRVFPPSVVERLGIRHVRGVLLYGPPGARVGRRAVAEPGTVGLWAVSSCCAAAGLHSPAQPLVPKTCCHSPPCLPLPLPAAGTGKTLIARQIGKMLNGKEPKIVNGPEVLNKYVGASEENIRNLFADAENDYKKLGESSGGWMGGRGCCLLPAGCWLLATPPAWALAAHRLGGWRLCVGRWLRLARLLLGWLLYRGKQAHVLHTCSATLAAPRPAPPAIQLAAQCICPM